MIELCNNFAKVPTLMLTFSSHLWVAKWWTQGDTPGGTSPLLISFTSIYLVLHQALQACGPTKARVLENPMHVSAVAGLHLATSSLGTLEFLLRIFSISVT